MKDFQNIDFKEVASVPLPIGVASQLDAFKLPVYLPPLSFYVGSAAVRPTHLTEADERETWIKICERSRGIPDHIWEPHPTRDDLLYALHQRRIYLREKKSFGLVAGDSEFYPLCRPDLKGRGYGSALRIVRSLLDMLRVVTHYSPTGFRAAVSAHRQLVWWALGQGMNVPGDVLQDYEFDPRAGGIRLRRPYGIAQHNLFWGYEK